MTLPEDRCTTAERYGRAMQSSHLQVTADKPGDVDVLVAAGWAYDGLGCKLYRLRVQFDGMNRKDAARPSNARVGVNCLTMLRPAKLAMDAFALARAVRAGLRADERAVLLIAGSALHAWISPNCDHCGGRGFNGGFDVPRELCNHCAGTGKRHSRLGRTDEDHHFGRHLLTLMDAKTEFVAKRMRVFLSQRESASKIRRGAAEQALVQRLGELRSTAAQED